jgi:uridine phosphorylase
MTPGDTTKPSGIATLGDPSRIVRVVFGCSPEDVAEDVVITPFVPLKAFRRHLGEEVRELSPPFFYKGVTGTFGGRAVTVISTGVGPSRVGDCVGFLSLTPARRVLFAGAVGGLADCHNIGEFFVPTAAADGEGYTRHAGADFAAAVRSSRVVPRPAGFGADLLPWLATQAVPVHEGAAFTVGAITFESRENLQILAHQGYEALEMELSALFSAGALHGLGAAALTYISDLPLRSSLWEEKGAAQEVALRSAYRALPLLALRYLAEN